MLFAVKASKNDKQMTIIINGEKMVNCVVLLLESDCKTCKRNKYTGTASCVHTAIKQGRQHKLGV